MRKRIILKRKVKGEAKEKGVTEKVDFEVKGKSKQETKTKKSVKLLINKLLK